MLEQLLKELGAAAANLGIRLVAAVLVLVIGFKLISIFLKRLKKSKGFEKIQDTAETFILSLINISLKVLLVLTCIAILGIPMTNIVALFTTAGVAVGLALQGSLSNLCGGIVILISKPFQVGDFISTEGVDGTVTSISIFYTTINTTDNKRHTIPNATISNSVITNFSAEEKRMAEVKIGISYSADVNKAKDILLSVAKAHPLVINDPKEPIARLLRFDDSAVVLVLRAWCMAGDYWNVVFDFNETIKTEFEKAGIEIPFPQLSVHIEEKK